MLHNTLWVLTVILGILWQVEGGHMLKIFQGHTGLVQCAAFSQCGRMLATGSWDHTVRVWPLNRAPASSGKFLFILQYCVYCILYLLYINIVYLKFSVF